MNAIGLAIALMGVSLGRGSKSLTESVGPAHLVRASCRCRFKERFYGCKLTRCIQAREPRLTRWYQVSKAMGIHPSCIIQVVISHAKGDPRRSPVAAHSHKLLRLDCQLEDGTD